MNKFDFFDQVANSHDPLLFTETDRVKVERLGRRMGALHGRRILEPGCGVGPLTEYLADWVGPTGHVLAFDASSGMANQCHSRLMGIQQVEVRTFNLSTLQLAPGSWDIVILFRVFPHLDDKSAVLRRIRPWLAPKGRLVIANLEGSAQLNALHAGFSEPVRHDHMPCRIGTTRLLEEAGYRVLTIHDDPDEFYAEASVAE